MIVISRLTISFTWVLWNHCKLEDNWGHLTFNVHGKTRPPATLGIQLSRIQLSSIKFSKFAPWDNLGDESSNRPEMNRAGRSEIYVPVGTRVLLVLAPMPSEFVGSPRPKTRRGGSSLQLFSGAKAPCLAPRWIRFQRPNDASIPKNSLDTHVSHVCIYSI